MKYGGEFSLESVEDQLPEEEGDYQAQVSACSWKTETLGKCLNIVNFICYEGIDVKRN